MALSLSKNQTISLDKTAAGRLRTVTLGVGWDPVQPGFFGKLMGQGGAIDLDASCIVFDHRFNTIDLVWFRQLQSSDGSIKHSGDNRTGEGDGDDETIVVDLQKLSAQATSLVFTVNSFTGQSFEKVANAYCRIVDTERGQELARFNLAEQGLHTGIVMACLARGPSGWNFSSIGQNTHGRTADDLVSCAAQAIRGPASGR